MEYLDLLIIEYKKRQEQEREDNRPFLELPIPEYIEQDVKDEVEEPKRVIILEL